MKAKDLIEKLKKLDPETVIYVREEGPIAENITHIAEKGSRVTLLHKDFYENLKEYRVL